MLYGSFPNDEKPEELVDPDYEGSAMEALYNFRIPFPYKVAKCMDPFSYRNIEFDVWTNERQEEIQKCTRRQDQERHFRPRGQFNVAKLRKGTPCMLKYESNESLYGFIMGPCPNDRHLMEIYLPDYRYNVYVHRSAVLPIRSLPTPLMTLPRCPEDQLRLPDLRQLQLQVKLSLLRKQLFIWKIRTRILPLSTFL